MASKQVIDVLEKDLHKTLDVEVRAHNDTFQNNGQSESNVVEEDAVDWVDDGEDEEEARVALGLVGKIWTDRHINANAFMATMKMVWQPKHGVDISNLGENVFVFQFHHWRDKQRVVDEQPWHFDNYAILFGDIEGNKKPSDLMLFELPMWVRVYNLPFKGRFNMMNVEGIGNKLGRFVKLDNSGAMGIDKSIRIRVKIDVRKPLAKQVKVKMRGGVEEFFEVKYEKPPLFCFFCGKIGHGVKDCHECRDEEEQPMEFGGWLKASPWKRTKQPMDKMGTNKQVSCAKPLFITKPQATKPMATIQQVEDVSIHLRTCEISDKNKEEKNTGRSEKENDGESHSRDGSDRSKGETGEGKRTSEAEEFTLQQHLTTSGGGLEERDRFDGSDLVMQENCTGRAWKRYHKKTEVGGGGTKKDKMIGKRRKERIADGEVEEIQGGALKKPRDEMTISLVLAEEEIAEQEVAGPTPWALGDP